MKKNITLTILILLFGIQITISQNYLSYYETINKAEIANLDKDFQKSDSLYQISFQLVKKPFKEDYFLAAVNADNILNNNKVYDYLKNGVINGLTLKRIKKSNINNFKKTKQYKYLIKEFDDLNTQYIETLNIPFRNEIIKMIKYDQKIRKPIFGNSKKYTSTAKSHYQRLLEIIEANDNKWPGFSTIGETTPKGKYNVKGNIALMLLHFSGKEVEELKPYMLQAVIDGEMYPYHYARIIDYKNILDCQIYGTYKYNEKSDLGEICDCNKADEERKKIGFETVKDFYRKLKSEYKCRTEK
jgi:hypothetical protein